MKAVLLAVLLASLPGCARQSTFAVDIDPDFNADQVEAIVQAGHEWESVCPGAFHFDMHLGAPFKREGYPVSVIHLNPSPHIGLTRDNGHRALVFIGDTAHTRVVATHEFGHVLGLPHASSPNSVMYSSACSEHPSDEDMELLRQQWVCP